MSASISPKEEKQDSALTLSVPNTQSRLRWVMLAFIPSSLMVSVTTYISTDIAAIPLLWIIPLTLYLLSFTMAFARRPLLPDILWARALPILILPLVVTMAVRANHPFILLMPLHLLTLFIVAMACHGKLAQERPPTDFLTEFYLWISVGGVLGGAFNALLAPVIFHGVLEYPITLVLACWMGLRQESSSDKTQDQRASILDFALPLTLAFVMWGTMLILQKNGIESGPLFLSLTFGFSTLWAFSFSRRSLRFALAIGAILTVGLLFYKDGNSGRLLVTERSFFGVHRVSLDPTNQFHQLFHGNTLHGIQNLDPKYHSEPLSYYNTSGPAGQVFQQFGKRLQNIGVVGLGAGSLAYYARPQQRWTFFEIDPVVAQIAGAPQYFSYLQNCKAPYEIVLGDGRLKLADVSDGKFDLLVLDAYSSDSLPVHLLTREALQLYFRKIKPQGLLVFHISNRHLNIEPVLGNLASDANVVGLNRTDGEISEAEAKLGKTSSQWLIMAHDKSALFPLQNDTRWQPLKTRDNVGVWTDNYSSLLSVFNW